MKATVTPYYNGVRIEVDGVHIVDGAPDAARVFIAHAIETEAWKLEDQSLALEDVPEDVEDREAWRARKRQAWLAEQPARQAAARDRLFAALAAICPTGEA